MRFVGSIAAVAALMVLVGCQGGKDGEKGKYDTGIKELESKDIEVGTGREAKEGDVVFVLYRGTFLKDGQQFESTMDDPEAKAPFSFMIGRGEVVKGWDEGVPGMKEGGVRELKVPYLKAYGDPGRGNIPPKADLKFDVKLLYVLKKDEAGVYDVFDDKVGAGATAQKGDKVTIHYVGSYLSGKIWDDSRERGKSVTFPLEVTDESMPGLIAGIEGMRVGGKRTLVIPPALVFGVAGTGAVEGSQPVRIVVDLLSVNGKGE